VYKRQAEPARILNLRGVTDDAPVGPA